MLALRGEGDGDPIRLFYDYFSCLDFYFGKGYQVYLLDSLGFDWIFPIQNRFFKPYIKGAYAL